MKKILQKYKYEITLLTMSFIGLLYFSIGINSWKFAFVGDEWTFYSKAKMVAENGFSDPFALKGAYAETPLLGSIYQAFFFKLFGSTNAAWRMSNVILIIPLSVFFFLWLKKLFDQQIAIISTLLLQCSFYLANFFKIGKPIPPSLILFVFLLYLGARCINQKPIKELILFGIILGISFYIYIGPIFPLILYPYLIIMLQKKHTFKQIIIYLALITSIVLIVLLPAMFQLLSDQSYLSQAAKKTILKKEFTDNNQIAINIFHNFFLFFRNYDYMYNHFVSGPYLDVISRISALIGIIIAFITLKKRSYLVLLLVFVLTAITIGLTSPYTYAPTTRGIFFIPIGCAFAGIGLYICFHQFIHKWKWFFIGIILIIVFLLNYYQSQIGVFINTQPNPTSLILKFLQETKHQNENKTVNLVLSKKSSFNYQNISIMQQAYQLDNVHFIVIQNSQLQCSSLKNSSVLMLKEDPLTVTWFKKAGCSNYYQIL